MNSLDIVHPNLGLLRYNNECDWYEGQVILGDRVLSISLETDEAGKIVYTLLERLNRLVAQLEEYAENAKDYAVDELLELKDEAWLDEDEKPLTPEQFKTRMVLESIAISSAGDVKFYHDDGNLFFGHCILITMDGSDRFIDADIPG